MARKKRREGNGGTICPKNKKDPRKGSNIDIWARRQMSIYSKIPPGQGSSRSDIWVGWVGEVIKVGPGEGGKNPKRETGDGASTMHFDASYNYFFNRSVGSVSGGGLGWEEDIPDRGIGDTFDALLYFSITLLG